MLAPSPSSPAATPPANLPNLQAAVDPNVTADAMNRVQSFLLQGQREEALRAAVEAREWPLALLLASVCDRAVYQQVVKGYADEKMMPGSVLHLMSLVFSGQSGDLATGTQSDLLHYNWRSNLVAILTNRTAGWDRLVRELGERLIGNGDVVSGHFCSMVSPHTHLVLVIRTPP